MLHYPLILFFNQDKINMAAVLLAIRQSVRIECTSYPMRSYLGSVAQHYSRLV